MPKVAGANRPQIASDAMLKAYLSQENVCLMQVADEELRWVTGVGIQSLREEQIIARMAKSKIEASMN